jgi:hypothetical protein
MKTVKYWAAIITSVVVGLIPATCVYFFWSWCMDQVPKANEWAGLIKVGITIVVAPMGLGISVWAGIIAMALSVAAWTAILD